MSDILRRVENTIWKTIDGEMVLLKPDTGDYFGLNDVGASFWEQIDGTKTLDAIIDSLHQDYEVQKDVLEADIRALLKQLQEKNLVIIAS